MSPSLKPVQKKQLTIFSVLYFIAAFAVLYFYGVNTGGEAFKYLLDAKSIAGGRPLNFNEFSYFFVVYSLFLSGFIKLKVSLLAVAIIQIVLSYGAAYCLYKLIVQKSANHFFGMVMFVCYLFCYPVQKWIFFIYSEGVHTSLVVIGFCIFIKMLDNFTGRNIFYFVALSLAITTTRPVGVLFLLAAYITFMLVCFTKMQYKIFGFSLAVGIVLCIAVLNSPVRYFINPDSLKRMELICMVPQESITADYSQFNREGLIGAFKVVKNDIGFSNFFKAGTKKLVLFFGFVRPYYSKKNNIFLAANWLFYPFALIGIFFNRQKEFSIIKTFSILLIFITAAGIFVTCDDWGNRFIAPIFPFLIVLAVLGSSVVLTKITKLKS